MSVDRDDFEYRHIDYDSNSESCLLGEHTIGDVEFRAYRTTREGRLSTRGQQALIVCMACGRSMSEGHGERLHSWWFNHNLGIHAEDCDGQRQFINTA